MAYSEAARELRRCKGTRADGHPCKAWAVWGGALCAAHLHKTRGPGGPEPWLHVPSKARCDCAAYPFPHRPAAGLCRWPEPPRRKWDKPAGTHSWMKPGRATAYYLAGGSFDTTTRAAEHTFQKMLSDLLGQRGGRD